MTLKRKASKVAKSKKKTSKKQMWGGTVGSKKSGVSKQSHFSPIPQIGDNTCRICIHQIHDDDLRTNCVHCGAPFHINCMNPYIAEQCMHRRYYECPQCHHQYECPPRQAMPPAGSGYIKNKAAFYSQFNSSGAHLV